MRIAGALLLWGLSAAARAADESERATPGPSADAVANLGAMVGGLAIVIVCIFALAWLARRFSWTRFLAQRSDGPIRMLGSLSLGTRERLLLVEVEGRRILLGVTPGEISRLDAAPDGARGADFDAALSRAEDRR